MRSRQKRHYHLSNECFNEKYCRKHRRISLYQTKWKDSTVGTVFDTIISTNECQEQNMINEFEQSARGRSAIIQPNRNSINSQILSYDLEDNESDVFVNEAVRLTTIENLTKNNSKQIKIVSDLNSGDVIFMVLNFYLRHALTQEALVDLLKMLNVVFGFKCFPENFESFFSVFPDPYDSCRVYFCENCHCVIGHDPPNSETRCPIQECGSKKLDYFITLSVENQVKETYLKYLTEIGEYEHIVREQKISDISKGKMFELLQNQETSKLITLSVNTDGAAAYRWSGHKPCYPIFLTINNLPPRLRFSKNNIILAAIWLSKGDPDMSLFFKEFMDEMKKLQQGIKIGTEEY
ncbi:uncharacterized protein LOC129732252 isoform X1 [Wyeomyia smithii]|uniref:uncharacterized protein LOC129732252 isoform X1 n=1 Tax=Wyeomyia smithii TaxID=174621 RepID=UPI0024681010|nr:uncharacterized protein LOC129732252 isoform X1 [Wyeomyia smithii]